MRKSITVFLAVFALALAGGSFAQKAPNTLRGADTAAADQAGDTKAYVGKKPGLQDPIARTFEKQPPLIPHAVDNFDEINLEDNQCMSCHSPENYVKKEAPKVGDSHFVDAQGKKLDSLTGSRYACNLCHVPQVDAKPLVDSTFDGGAGVTQTSWKKKK